MKLSTTLMRSKFVITNFLLAISFLFVNNVFGQTVQTDKTDYLPGDTVSITGTGWQPGETVNLYINSDCDECFFLLLNCFRIKYQMIN